MNNLRKAQITFAVHSIHTMYTAVKDGLISYDQARKFALRYWWNYNLKKDEVYRYLDRKEDENNQSPPDLTNLTLDGMYNKIPSEICRYALDYFGLTKEMTEYGKEKAINDKS